MIADSIKVGNCVNNELNGLYKLYIDCLTKRGEVMVGDLSKACLREEGTYEGDVMEGV